MKKGREVATYKRGPDRVGAFDGPKIFERMALDPENESVWLAGIVLQRMFKKNTPMKGSAQALLCPGDDRSFFSCPAG